MNEEVMKLMRQMADDIKVLRAEIVVLQHAVDTAKINRQYFELAEACEFLHVKRTKMQQLLKEGEFPFAVKKGRKWLFPALKLKQYASNLV